MRAPHTSERRTQISRKMADFKTQISQHSLIIFASIFSDNICIPFNHIMRPLQSPGAWETSKPDFQLPNRVAILVREELVRINWGLLETGGQLLPNSRLGRDLLAHTSHIRIALHVKIEERLFWSPSLDSWTLANSTLSLFLQTPILNPLPKPLRKTRIKLKPITRPTHPPPMDPLLRKN